MIQIVGAHAESAGVAFAIRLTMPQPLTRPGWIAGFGGGYPEGAPSGGADPLQLTSGAREFSVEQGFGRMKADYQALHAIPYNLTHPCSSAGEGRDPVAVTDRQAFSCSSRQDRCGKEL
ncbi:hypothetical protein CR492_15605 [Methylocella silvestris]|uniref:Uncharacterized protein n=1 Tax=Methylocella silvestris TaxID=199596 RepID=A0A2J7TE65_METSI|nr:hypothetical protein CR492_15605 [Methylocella silvestris]